MDKVISSIFYLILFYIKHEILEKLKTGGEKY